jgi:hypothetical protein
MRLNSLAFGVTLGIMWGATVFLATLWIIVAGGPGEHLALLGRFYLGYTITVAGAFVGLVYGFVDGFIGGVIFAALYNLLAKPQKKEATG